MKFPIHCAVILAAGQGSRLGALGLNGPKALLEVGGKTLLLRSLELLAEAGISRVLLVTGHKAEDFEKNPAAPEGLHIEKLCNPDFRNFGSLLSLVVGLHQVHEPCLILDGDILYEPRALQAALENPADNVMVISSPTESGDEYYAWTNGLAQPLVQSKQITAMPHPPAGESVGILKCGDELRGAILVAAESLLQNSVTADYELAVCAAGQLQPIVCTKVDGLLWAEIDDEKMLDRARSVISPLLASCRAEVPV